MYWAYREHLLSTCCLLLEYEEMEEERPSFLREVLRQLEAAERDHFQAVLHKFLKTFAPDMTWLLDIPALFEDLVEQGIRFAEIQPARASSYFYAFARGDFGSSPAHIQHVLNWFRRLLLIDPNLAFAFLQGAHLIVKRLTPKELDLYIEEGLSYYEINERLAQHFLEATLPDCDAAMATLTRECRLPEIDTHLETLLFALTGQKIAVLPIGELPSHKFMLRRPSMMCLARQTYLPARIRYFTSAATNRTWYLLQAIVAAGMFAFKSFACVHGHVDYRTAAVLAGDVVLRQNLFQVLEYARVLHAIHERWPGSRRLLDFGIRSEYERHPPVRSSAEQLFFDVVAAQKAAVNASVRLLRELAGQSCSVFHTAELLSNADAVLFLSEYPDLDEDLLRPLPFLPDFFYPVSVSLAPSDEEIAVMKQDGKPRKVQRSEREDAFKNRVSDRNPVFHPAEQTVRSEIAPGCYAYDEWSQERNAYHPRYCSVYEREIPFMSMRPIPADAQTEGHKIRRVFELLKPQNARKEKRLPEGDDINPDLLINYVIASKREPCPPVQFFEKPLISKRDVAVLLLLDISGSTGEMVNDRKVIEIEKQAALVFGNGLAALDDQFAICGFSSQGREHCEFLIFKDFRDVWDHKNMSRVLSAQPMSSTRMGAALRHSGYRLQQVERLQKLIILITDGKPLDHDYSPQTRYAQHDVRMACLENKRQGIVTFCLSTLENTRSDLELMFPDRRFVILNSIQRLTQLLPRYYMKLTL
ncbi:CbbO protein [Candidatus Vecturithrix granuli]|uniref:CbbO protein n=1 Tax=Vecturithrix granuli TaxID=1499967 RepID=A0A081C6D4_VECG1|nr:CbbO protein [Candidatus Vecturithrix granuli]